MKKLNKIYVQKSETDFCKLNNQVNILKTVQKSLDEKNLKELHFMIDSIDNRH